MIEAALSLPDMCLPLMRWAWEGWPMAFIHMVQLSCMVGWIEGDDRPPA